MKKIKLLFQGDSITYQGRDYNNPIDLGTGYVKIASEMLKTNYPDIEFEFVNRGISGNKTKDLLGRLKPEIIDIKPDIISILIGINDVIHYVDCNETLPNNVFEEQYRTILEGIKSNTNAKIMIMEPFVIPKDNVSKYRNDLSSKIEIIRKLAREYADVYMPTEGLLNSVYIGGDLADFSQDGIHPSHICAQFIAGFYCEYIAKIISNI